MGQNTGILATAFTLPEEVLTYEELEDRFGAKTMKKVLSGAGIRNRRIAPPDVCGSDLAYDAASRLLSYHEIDPQSIDLLIFCTQTPDYFLPTTACVLHKRLNLKRECACFDINLGCSQYVYALSVAHSMIASKVASRALVLTGDTLGRTLHPMDRSVVPLLGDGGSATLVGEVPEGQGFLGFELGTDGSGSEYLMIPAGGFRIPISEETGREVTDSEGNVRTQQNLYMNGAAIFHFAISVVPEVVRRVLDKHSLSIDDIDLFLFHQANKFMLDYLLKKLNISPDKTHFFLEDVGNSSGTTVPAVLTEAWRANKIRPGALVLLVGFGVGLSWAATIVRWPENSLGIAPN
jgi:3-oxoacyl-[acyl-carrier-protein] synthase III